MKRLGSSDSLGALMSICPTAEEHSPRSTHVYSREFQSMLDGLDEEGCVEESGHVSEKKRRLSVQQVKALEKDFEVENKLEPERKVKLAQDLGLQPRQVAVWFQNRRARWKTKQLERDYGLLKSNYDNLKLNHDSLQRDNEALLKEITELKSKLNEENGFSIKEERFASEAENNDLEESDEPSLGAAIVALSEHRELNYDDAFHYGDGVLIFPGVKDGSSDDSDSSAILNEDNNSPNVAISSSGALQNHNKNGSSSLKFNCSSHSQLNCFKFSDPKAISSNAQKAAYQPQLVKLEEHNFFSGEEACNFFSDEQAPSLHWYCPDQWN